MQRRALYSTGLAIALPIGSTLGIQDSNVNPAWLSLPDAIICIALLQGLRKDRSYWLFFAGLMFTITLAVSRPDLSGIFPGLLFLLIAQYFRKSLRADQTPLITQLASAIRGPDMPMSLETRNYTLGLTRAWCMLLVLLAVNQGIWAIAAGGPWPWMMGNAMAPMVIFLFLILEPLYRRYTLPNEPRHSLRHFLTRLAETDWKSLK